MYVCIHTHTRVCVCIYTYTHKNVYKYIYVCTYVYMYVRVCVYIYFDKEKYVLNIYRKKGWMPKEHPTKDYVQPICKLSRRLATSKVDPPKSPLSKK